jgi:carbamoyltransferase
LVVMGLGFTEHDSSAAIVINGKLTTAIARERLTRIKRDGTVWGSAKVGLDAAIHYCLEQNGLTVRDVDLVVWNHIDHVSSLELTALSMSEGSKGLFGRPFLVLPHHFAHACCAFYLSPFPEAAVLIVDGRGGTIAGLKRNCTGPEPEAVMNGKTIVQDLKNDRLEQTYELESFYRCDDHDWMPLRKIVGGEGIGDRYGKISHLLFGDMLAAGKTMGLAPYGVPGLQSALLERRGPADMPVFSAARGPAWETLKGQIRAWQSTEMPRDYTEPLPAAVAATIQQEAEEALLTHARWLRRTCNSTNLCISGGVALNCVANSRIAKESGFDDVFVPAAPGDDGVAVGCALYGAALHGELRREWTTTFLGRSYLHSSEEIKTLGLTPVSAGTCCFGWIAQQIAEGAVVAWYWGGAELGPRALGHRSFLADPRKPQMRDYLNEVVKGRETFRPFAPVVLEEAVTDFFEDHHPSNFMSFVGSVRPKKRSDVLAITHIDGTARYQVLRKRDNPELDSLIRAFMEITAVPMLLNTSFNRAGEPIVETPEQAAHCLLASSAHYLVLDGLVYRPS